MHRLLILSMVAGASVARADGTTYTSLVEIGAVEPGCRPLAEVPQNASIPGPRYDAAISTANCMAETRARRLVLTPTPDSVRALDEAVSPSLRILDRVIATGDAEHALIALYAKLDIVQGNAARLLLAVPRLSPQMGGMEVANHYKMVLVADALTKPWRQHAMELRRAIAGVVSKNPQLANHDPVVAYMIAKSRIVEAVGLAGR